LVIGYSLAAVCGVTLGVIFSNSNPSILRLIMGMPTLAWMPIFLIVFGMGDESVIAAIFISSVFVIILNTIQGIQSIDPDIIWAARLDGASGFVLLVKILIPCAIVSIVSGLRLAIGYSWRALVGAEMLAVMIRYGLGKLLWESRYWADFGTMIMSIGVIVVCGAMLDRGLKEIEKA
jgi:NitT/TauT family transport system permease protein